jgi:hypothetical protein
MFGFHLLFDDLVPQACSSSHCTLGILCGFLGLLKVSLKVALIGSLGTLVMLLASLDFPSTFLAFFEDFLDFPDTLLAPSRKDRLAFANFTTSFCSL